jgi:hypothetical protein
MLVIASSIFAKEAVKPDDAAVDHLKKYFEYLHKGRDKHFGNARSVRQVVGEVIRNQNLRLASMKKEDRTPAMLEAIIFDDVKEFEIKEMNTSRPTLGFQVGRK